MSSIDTIIVGTGFLGMALAQKISSLGLKILGIVKNSSTEFFKNYQFDVLACDITDADAVNKLSIRCFATPLLIYCVSTRGGSPHDYKNIYYHGLINILKYWNPEKIFFISSTSVYHQHHGEWVDENSPTISTPDQKTQILIESENLVLNNRGIILRLSGLYGGNRKGIIQRFLDGQQYKLSHWCNHIHRDDAISAILHLMNYPFYLSHRVFNVTDNTPLLESEIYSALKNFKEKIILKRTETVEKKRIYTSKRVVNHLLKSIGWNPCYRSYILPFPL